MGVLERRRLLSDDLMMRAAKVKHLVLMSCSYNNHSFHSRVDFYDDGKGHVSHSDVMSMTGEGIVCSVSHSSSSTLMAL